MMTEAMLMNELIQAKELAKQLKFHLDKDRTSTGEILLDKIISSFDRAISKSSMFSLGDPLKSSLNPKRRKILTEKVRVNPSDNNGFEEVPDDGYSWRKYGQKVIVGAKYPRCYYRCSYRYAQQCLAVKRVQKSSNPSILDVTYLGEHTCFDVNSLSYNLNKEQNQNQLEIYKRSKGVVLLDFEKGKSVKVEEQNQFDWCRGQGKNHATSEVGTNVTPTEPNCELLDQMLSDLNMQLDAPLNDMNFEFPAPKKNLDFQFHSPINHMDLIFDKVDMNFKFHSTGSNPTFEFDMDNLFN